MIEIGVFDLKAHLSEVIKRVEKGEKFAVTNRGKTVAILSTPEEETRTKEANFFATLLLMMRHAPVAKNKKELQAMIQEGRK